MVSSIRKWIWETLSCTSASDTHGLNSVNLFQKKVHNNLKPFKFTLGSAEVPNPVVVHIPAFKQHIEN